MSKTVKTPEEKFEAISRKIDALYEVNVTHWHECYICQKGDKCAKREKIIDMIETLRGESFKWARRSVGRDF